MRMKLEPSRLSGAMRAISSKSAAHRSLICAALSDGKTLLRISDRSADIDATIECLQAMGADIEIQGDRCQITPIKSRNKNVALNCRESGSTLRFLLPLAAVLCDSARITGEGRLPERPLEELRRTLSEHGVAFQAVGEQRLPLDVRGTLSCGTYTIEGNISSQYISGLLFALPLLKGDSEIQLTSPMESSAYVDMTIEALQQYGIRAERKKDGQGFFVPGEQTYRTPGGAEAEGDWSNAAFFLAAGALGAAEETETDRQQRERILADRISGITYKGLDPNSIQGDKEIMTILEQFGAHVETDQVGQITVRPGRLRGIEIDVSQIPDLMPILAITACGAEGTTVLKNAGRLRMKESDRLASTAALIHDLGGEVEEETDRLIVHGTGGLRGGCAHSFGDHRIAMSAAIAALICREPVLLEQAESVTKSYPEFYRDYRLLGGKADVI